MLGSKATFPVGERIDGVFLKRVTYEARPEFEALKASFYRQGAWITLFVVNPEKDEDPEITRKRRYRAALKIESLASLFIKAEAMRACFRSAESFQDFCERIIEELEKTSYKTIELELKTLPGPKVGFAVPFVRKRGDKKRNLSYSEFELKQLLC